jgi:hypothetical protein
MRRRHNMNRFGLLGFTAVIGLALGSLAVNAAPLPKEFKLTKINGDCSVALPGGDQQIAREGVSYPYGSTIKTGRKASLVVVLSEGNEVRVLAETTFVADQSAKNSSEKTIKLREGRIQVRLDPKFHETNKFTVETPSAICGAIGSDFDITTSGGTGANSTIVLCTDGAVSVAGLWPQWQTTLDAGDGIAISTITGDTFMTIRATSGRFDINYTSGDGTSGSLNLGVGTAISLTSAAGTGPNGQPVVTIRMTVTQPDGSTRSVGFWVPLTGPVAPGRGTPESISRLFTSGGTLTPVGPGRGRE